MAEFLSLDSTLTGLVGVGMPPSVQSSEPLGLVDSIVVIVILVLAFWWYTRVVIWLEVKITSRQLFREIYREYRKRRPRPGGPGG